MASLPVKQCVLTFLITSRKNRRNLFTSFLHNMQTSGAARSGWHSWGRADASRAIRQLGGCSWAGTCPGTVSSPAPLPAAGCAACSLGCNFCHPLQAQQKGQLSGLPLQVWLGCRVWPLVLRAAWVSGLGVVWGILEPEVLCQPQDHQPRACPLLLWRSLQSRGNYPQ